MIAGRVAKPYHPRGWYEEENKILPYAERNVRQQRILWELSCGLPGSEIAHRHKVSRAYVSKLKKKGHMAKIVPFGRSFNNFKGFLAHVAEDEHAVGFVGVVVRLVDGQRELAEVNFGSSTAEAALASLIIGKLALEGDSDGERD